MSIDIARNALLWCAIINYAVLVVWFWFLVLAREWLHRLWGRWFHLVSAEQFDAANFNGILFYKVAILFFNLVPYVVLRIVA